MDAGALDAQQDAQVDGGPAGVRLAAVAALLVAGQQLDPLQDALPADAALPRLAGRIDAAGGRRGRSVQVLGQNSKVIRITEYAQVISNTTLSKTFITNTFSRIF